MMEKKFLLMEIGIKYTFVVFCLIGNTLVVICCFKYEYLRKKSYLFVLCLAGTFFILSFIANRFVLHRGQAK